MEVIIRGEAKEIAALVVAIQERQDGATLKEIAQSARQLGIPQSTPRKRRVWCGKSVGWVERNEVN